VRKATPRSAASRDDDRRVYQSPRWKGLRRAKLARDPWCEWPEGCGRIATIVDHIVSIRDGGPDFPDLDDLSSTCFAHHSTKTLREIRRRQTRGTPCPD
jgi:5-methylcytosine-specific restriction endonuclease McrA